MLNWTTALEINANNFDIEHSIDGIHFSSIGTVAATNNNAANNYYFTDTNPVNGVNFYRLKQTDISDNFTYSSITAISINKPVIAITSINPNPVINNLAIFCVAENKENIICKIYSAEGREVKNIATTFVTGENNLTVDVSSLTKGIYFIVISKTDEKITEAKFVKQ